MTGNSHRGRTAAVVLLALILTAVLSGCGGGDGYCQTVTDQQASLSKEVESGGSAGFVAALPTFEDLKRQAPDDIADEWQQVTTRIEALKKALDAAGISPSEYAAYDPKKPPSDLTAEQRTAIAAAATQLGSAETLQSFAAVQQQVRDVCHVSLTY